MLQMREEKCGPRQGLLSENNVLQICCKIDLMLEMCWFLLETFRPVQFGKIPLNLIVFVNQNCDEVS